LSADLSPIPKDPTPISARLRAACGAQSVVCEAQRWHPHAAAARILPLSSSHIDPADRASPTACHHGQACKGSQTLRIQDDGAVSDDPTTVIDFPGRKVAAGTNQHPPSPAAHGAR